MIDSIREGFGVVRRHLKDVAMMWLIIIGVRIGWAIAIIASLILLFPVILLLIVVEGVVRRRRWSADWPACSSRDRCRGP